MAKKGKDKEAAALTKAVNAAAKTKGVSKEELKFIKDLQKAAKKGGNVTKDELAAIKKEIAKQAKDKNSSVAKAAKANPGKYLKKKVKEIKDARARQDDSTPSTTVRAPIRATNDRSIRASYPSQIKTPSTDVINLQDQNFEDPATTFNQFVRDFGGIELSILSNHKTITGQNTKFDPIKDLPFLWKQNNPLYDSEDATEPESFSINLFDFLIKNTTTGEVQENVTMATDGTITIDFNDIPQGLVVDVEITALPTVTGFEEGLVI